MANDLGGWWIVLREPEPRPGWRNTVTMIHTSEAAARTEAERLARELGCRFVVFRAVAAVSPAEPVRPPLAWEDEPWRPQL